MTSEGQIKSYFARWQRLEEAKKAVADDLKELFSETKHAGFENKALRIAFNTKAKAEAETDADRELSAVVDIYLTALEAPRASRAYTRGNIGEFDTETGEILDRDARRRARTSEAMDDNIAFSAEMVADGLISEEAHAENVALSNAVARKYGNGPMNTHSGAISTPDAAVTSSSRDSATEGAELEPRPLANPVANVGEEFADKGAASSDDPASRTDDVRERQHASTVGFADDCRTGGKEHSAAAAAPVGDAAANALGIPAPDQPLTGGYHEVAGSQSAATGEGRRALPERPKSKLRPNCLQPEMCRSGTRDHCYSCRKSMAHEEEFA
jgi:uncharacterized protein (UPF0335 family)